MWSKTGTSCSCQINVQFKRTCHHFYLAQGMSSLFTHHHRFALTIAKVKWMKERRTRRGDKTEEENKWLLDPPVQRESGFCLFFQRISLRTSRSLSLNSAGFLCLIEVSRYAVCCISSIKETKCGIVKTECFHCLCFTFLCFSFITQTILVQTIMVESKRCFHWIKERETENNCMLSQHVKSPVGPWLHKRRCVHET